MIVGVGVDLVDVARFEKSISDTPALLQKLFVESELAKRGDSEIVRVRSLAARFAAKEAFAKSLGAPKGLHWHEVEVSNDDDGAPFFKISGTTADVASSRGVKNFHLSISHDGPNAIAFVIAEGGV